jgi:hypothetical protein
MRLRVVSTGHSPPHDGRDCRESVAAALANLPASHVYVDAARQTPPLGHFQNLFAATQDLDPTDVIISLDADDCLATPETLRIVYEAHAAGAWVTWGSYVHQDGRPGIARPLAPSDFARIRRIPWVTSHLKTYRAGLLRRILSADLQTPDGAWLSHARDMAVMYPVLEMAGYERSRYLPNTLVIYNYASSTEFNASAAVRGDEERAVVYVRGLPPYPRLESLT